MTEERTKEKKTPRCSLYLLRVQQSAIQGFTEVKLVLYIFDSPKTDLMNLLNLLLETTWFASTLNILPQPDEAQCGNISSEKTPSASFIWCPLVVIGNAPLRVHLLPALMILETSSTSAFHHSFSGLTSLSLNSYFS